ncbi:MAG TPA: argininosuccinate lyase [Actinomycetota bacterium]|nr:argininosuccinate lyase [Actinomycetota bacterium]
MTRVSPDGSDAERMLWAGRFDAPPDQSMLDFTSSFGVDVRLLEHDLAATRAHARVLGHAGILDPAEVEKIDGACMSLLSDWLDKPPAFEPTDEDVHTYVERALSDRLGDLGRKIHAGRSRNDLVVTDLRLWCKAASVRLAVATAKLLDGIIAVAGLHTETVMPGYTHLQRAQPVSLAFHLLAHGFALERDGRRFSTAYRSADVSTLGAGAIAGSTLGLDPSVAQRELGFESLFANAMDAVAARDFAVDLAYACASTSIQMSRLCEDICLWTSAEFGFARLADEWSTGSSMMPQKRNPDVAELIRGRAAVTLGELMTLMTMLKGLPMAYNRDLQEDKAVLFAAVDRTEACLAGLTSLLASLNFDVERMSEAVFATEGIWATDLAERLVQRGVPFRDAHAMAGRAVARTGDSAELQGLTGEDLGALASGLLPEDVADLDPAAGMSGRATPGGTAPLQVERQIEELTRLTTSLTELGTT